MRKQIVMFAMFAMMAAVSITGCKKKETVDLTGIHTTEATTTAETMAETKAPVKVEIKETEAAGSDASAVLSVQAKIATEKNGKTMIEYPILSNLRNADTEDSVNTLIKKYALKLLDVYMINPEKDNVTIACDVLSLDRSSGVFAFTGSMMPEGAAYPTELYYTLTVDLNKGKIKGLSDYADPYTMAGYILSEDCIITKSIDDSVVKDYLSSLDINVLWETLKNCDFNSQNEDGYPQAFSYELQGIIYMAIPVPHALGDYAIVEFHPETK